MRSQRRQRACITANTALQSAVPTLMYTLVRQDNYLTLKRFFQLFPEFA